MSHTSAPRSPYRISEARRAELMAIAQAMSGVRPPEEPPLKPERHQAVRASASHPG